MTVTEQLSPLVYDELRRLAAAHLAKERPGQTLNPTRYSEEACQFEPKNGLLLNTLGLAYYRVGNYEKVLETLLLGSN